MADLHISDDLSLPLTVVTEKLAILAQSGAGKSYTAMRLAELMLGAGAQIVALDPVGCWFGLRATADGAPSGLPIVVFGGEHGDLALDPKGGEAIADVLVDLNLSAVLDLSDLEMPDQKRFTASFAERFFHRKKRSKSPVHLFLEEAQVFAPQFPERDETTMLNRVERLCRIGRNYGVGWTIVSQRPQEVHKKVLNQAGTLFALRTVGRHERKAIADWVVDKATAADAQRIDALPSLETGTAQVWSPAFLRVATTIQVSRRETFDSSRTPTVGEDAATAVLAPIDVDAIRARLAATVPPRPEPKAATRDQKRAAVEQARLIAEQQEVNEELRRQLQARSSLEVELVGALKAEVDALRSVAMRIIDAADGISAKLVQAGQFGAALRRDSDSLPSPMPRVGLSESAERLSKAAAGPNPRPAQNRRPVLAVATARTDGLSGPQARILNVLASFGALGRSVVKRGQVAARVETTAKAAGFVKNIGVLRGLGLIELTGVDTIAITEAGLALVDTTSLPSLDDLHEAWLAKVSRPQAAILRRLIDMYPKSAPRNRLALEVGQRDTPSGYRKNLGALRSLGLIDYLPDDHVVATDLLFPEGLR